MIAIEMKLPNPGALPDEMEIHLDRDGLKTLLNQLRFLEEGRTDHVHLMSAAWGGTHLEDEPLNADSVAIQHVKILLRQST